MYQVSCFNNNKFKSKIIILLSAIIITCYLLPVTCYSSYAEPISSTELIENAKSLDGKNVIYRGEVVTAILNRGEYSWVNLNDGYNAIGVWCRTRDLNFVKFIGDYKYRGDILGVEGIFNRACPIHGGELDIHADIIRFVKSGFPNEERISEKKINLSIALFLLAFFIIIMFRKRI